jgi:hypothetical protein
VDVEVDHAWRRDLLHVAVALALGGGQGLLLELLGGDQVLALLAASLGEDEADVAADLADLTVVGVDAREALVPLTFSRMPMNSTFEFARRATRRARATLEVERRSARASRPGPSKGPGKADKGQAR